MAVIEVRNLAKRYGEQVALDGVSFSVEQGEIFAVRHAGLVALAVTDRFALASLLLFDMRAVLHDLAEGGDGRGRDAA